MVADTEGDDPEGEWAIRMGPGRRRQSRPGRPARIAVRPPSALVVGGQRPELALELLRAEPLLAVTREDRLNGGIASLHCLKRGECCFHPILGQMIQHSVGFLAGRHNSDCTPVLGTPIGVLGSCIAKIPAQAKKAPTGIEPV